MQADDTDPIQPNRICLTCYDLLTRYYVFRNECLQSHNALQKYKKFISQKTNERAIEDVPSTATNTTTIIELNKDSDTCAESVVIKVEVDNEEYIIDTVIEDDLQDVVNYDSNERTELMEVAPDQSEINAQCISDPMTIQQRLINSIEPAEQQIKEPESLNDFENMCPLCNRIIEDRKQLIKHVNDHMPDNKCPYCKKYFEKKFGLRRHLNNHSGTYSRRAPACCISCNFPPHRMRLQCNLLFNSKLIVSICCVSVVRPYKAFCCYKRFKNKREMVLHVQNHTNKMENQKLAYLMLKQSDLIALTAD